jgi:hypothetical protein
MQRPIGIFIAGVILIVSGLLGLLVIGIGLLGILAVPTAHTTLTPALLALVIASQSVFALLDVFLCIVAIGLFRMSSWARYATIILAALGASFFALSAIGMLLVQRMPLPTPNVPAHTLHLVLTVMAVIYFVLSAIALFWIFYFNRSSVRSAFAAAQARRQAQGQIPLQPSLSPASDQPQLPQAPPPPVNPQPVLGLAQIVLWIVAVLFLIGGLSMIALMLLGTSIFVLGWNATGPAAFFIELLFASVLLYAGLGLIRRWRISWYLAVALQLFSIVSVALLLIPGYVQRLIHASEATAARLTPGVPVYPLSDSIMVASSAVGGLFALIILAVLVRTRKSYLS